MTLSTENFLVTVYGHGEGYVHLSTLDQQLAAVRCEEVATLAGKFEGEVDVYLAGAVIGTDKGSGGQGRIVDDDATQLTALWVDLDREGPGHKTKAPLWTRDDIKHLYEWLPIKPTAITDSGNGWWFHYVLADPLMVGARGYGHRTFRLFRPVRPYVLRSTVR